MSVSVVAVVGAVLGLTAVAAAQPSRKTVPIVSTTGCLREQGAGNWVLVAATDPGESIANAPPRTEVPTSPPDGRHRFKLIGVGEFNLPVHKDRTVVVRGLLIEDVPVSRLNLTSVVEATAQCAARAPK